MLKLTGLSFVPVDTIRNRIDFSLGGILLVPNIRRTERFSDRKTVTPLCILFTCFQWFQKIGVEYPVPKMSERLRCHNVSFTFINRWS